MTQMLFDVPLGDAKAISLNGRKRGVHVVTVMPLEEDAHNTYFLALV